MTERGKVDHGQGLLLECKGAIRSPRGGLSRSLSISFCLAKNHDSLIDQMTKRSRGPIRVVWDNPPGPDQGLTLEYPGGAEMRVGPTGLLSVGEAALALDLTKQRVYQLIDERLLRVRGSGVRRIPVASVGQLKFGSRSAGRSAGRWFSG